MSDVAVVTGAASGLGRAIAGVLHADGYRVVLADIDEHGVHAAAMELPGAMAARVDVRNQGSIVALLDRTLDAHGSADVLVNCAAVTQSRPLLEITPDELQRVLMVNAGGTFIASQLFGAHMAARRYGRIVNIASLAGQNGGTATGGHYAASKGAVLAITKVFARELAHAGVTVNAIAPGPHRTATVDSVVGTDNLPEFLRRIPVGALGEVEYVGRMVALLASRDAGFVTGATWDVNGGLNVR